MPFIHAKLTTNPTAEEMEAIKTDLGQAITKIPGKSEAWLMVQIQGNCALWHQGEAWEKIAMVEVQVYGTPSDESCNALTGEITKILANRLGYPRNTSMSAINSAPSGVGTEAISNLPSHISNLSGEPGGCFPLHQHSKETWPCHFKQ